MAALAAGGSANGSVSHTFSSAGTYSVRVCSDKTSSAGGGVISESDENNNCSAWTNVSVSNPIVQCNDGLDNDSDSRTDYPNDASCSSATDNDETNPPQCSDGVDNNGNGQIDYPNDPGCTNASDNTESSLTLTCSTTLTRGYINLTIPWTGSASGGTGPYTYTWNGTDVSGVSTGSTPTLNKAYVTSGQKTLTVSATDSLGAAGNATCFAAPIGGNPPASSIRIYKDASYKEI